MIGVTEWDSKAGIHVLALDLVAHPEFRDPTDHMRILPEVEAELRKGLSDRAFRKEYLRDWTVASGSPVYADDFVREWHVAKQSLHSERAFPIVRGWDLGPTHVEPACAICQMDSLGRLMVIGEIVTWDGRREPKTCDIEQFAEQVTVYCAQMYGAVEYIDYADPAAWTKSQTDMRSAITILNQHGIHPRPGPMTFVDRKRAVIDRLTRTVSGSPAIVVSPTCRMILEGLEGAYRYEEIGETGRYKPTVEKNAWSHIMNGLEYLIGGLYTQPRRQRDKDEARERRSRRRSDRVTGY